MNLCESFEVGGAGEVREFFCFYFGLGDWVPVFEELDVDGAVEWVACRPYEEAVVFVVVVDFIEGVFGWQLNCAYVDCFWPEGM